MADQNQNPLLPTLNEDEQFMSSENFSNAESALDWDALLTRGNSNNSQVAMSKWERDSLYVKFDPLVASRRDPADRASFVFKAPRPPEPLAQNKCNPFHPPSGKIGNPPPQNGESPLCSSASTFNCNMESLSPSPQSVAEQPSSPQTPNSNIQTRDELSNNSPPHGMANTSLISQSAQNATSPLQNARKSLSPSKTILNAFSPMQCVPGTPPQLSNGVEGNSSYASPNAYVTSPSQNLENTPPSQNVKSPSCILENARCTPSSPTIVSNSPLQNLQTSITQSPVYSPRASYGTEPYPVTRQNNVVTSPEEGQNTDYVSSPPCIVGNSQTPPHVPRRSSASLKIAALECQIDDCPNPQQILTNHLSPQQMQTKPAQINQVNHSSPNQSLATTPSSKQISSNPSAYVVTSSTPTKVIATPPPTGNVKSPSTPEKFIANPISSPESVPGSSSPPPEISRQSATEIFKENKKHKLKQLSKMELQLNENMEVYVKQKERFKKAEQERDATILERNEAQRELMNAESRFAEMLMMYEQLKNVTTTVEKNFVILQKREVILVDTLEKRETKEKASVDMYTDIMERIKHDFGNRIREKEAENVKLKAKIRMCEMKTTKLEGEIAQVDRESESLRKLCEDLMKS